MGTIRTRFSASGSALNVDAEGNDARAAGIDANVALDRW